MFEELWRAQGRQDLRGRQNALRNFKVGRIKEVWLGHWTVISRSLQGRLKVKPGLGLCIMMIAVVDRKPDLNWVWSGS